MSKNDFQAGPVMKPPFKDIPQVDLTKGFDPSMLKKGWGIGGYNEYRPNMYIAPQYRNERNIHMGIDIWAPAGEPVYAPLDGLVAYTDNHDEEGNYGATIVLKHSLGGKNLYALYGHLSLKSLQLSAVGKKVKAGDLIGWLGDESENGNWIPHLHYQLSWQDPGNADMPGVVSKGQQEFALGVFPDPEKILNSLI